VNFDFFPLVKKESPLSFVRGKGGGGEGGEEILDVVIFWRVRTSIRIVNNTNCEFEMAADLTNSSTSLSPVVLKISIDLDKYYRHYSKVVLYFHNNTTSKDQLETFQQHQRKRNRLKGGSSRNATKKMYTTKFHQHFMYEFLYKRILLEKAAENATFIRNIFVCLMLMKLTTEPDQQPDQQSDHQPE
jgi:hypothetical protein